MNEKELLDRLAELPREIAPRRDPWPEISARIDGHERSAATGRRTPGWLTWAAAASVATVVAAGLLLQSPATGPERPAQVAQGTQSGLTGTAGGGAPDMLAASEAEYQAAFREFIPVRESRVNLTLQTVEKIEMGWTELVNAESALSEALRANPNDPFLNTRMLELRARQLGFLRQIASLELSNRRMTI